MTNAYTKGILATRKDNTSLLESYYSNLGKQLATLSFGAVALRKVGTRMHKHLRGQASAELGENPQTRYSTTFLTILSPASGSGPDRLSRQ